MFYRLPICIYALYIRIYGHICPCAQSALHIYIYIYSARPRNTAHKQLALQETAVSMA